MKGFWKKYEDVYDQDGGRNLQDDLPIGYRWNGTPNCQNVKDVNKFQSTWYLCNEKFLPLQRSVVYLLANE